jgi:uncharacterized protein
MKRFFIEKLKKWADSPNRKPLVLSGARQVGKTWLLQELGRTHYAKTAYVNFERHPELASLFDGAFDFRRILTGLQAASGVRITPGDTLVILDEIQLCGRALTGLKYWQEECNDYPVATAGSLVGLTLLEGTGYPVGKTNTLTLYPMSFGEFLEAIGEGNLNEVVKSGDWKLVSAFASRLRELLKTYLLVGGMPASVAAYASTSSLAESRSVQMDVLSDYARDFAKHAPKRDVPRIRAIWDSLPRQLAKEDRRFVAAEVSVEGVKARSRDLHDPFAWLEAAGLAFRVWNVTKPARPLESYRNHTFKLFGLDVGLLAAQSHLEPSAVLEGDRAFVEFKGALTEQFVQQELRTFSRTPYTWAPSDSTAEVDFLVEAADGVVPLEVKAERNLQAKSLGVYRAKYAPARAVRTSLADGREENGLLDVPLYSLSAVFGDETTGGALRL